MLLAHRRSAASRFSFLWEREGDRRPPVLRTSYAPRLSGRTSPVSARRPAEIDLSARASADAPPTLRDVNETSQPHAASRMRLLHCSKCCRSGASAMQERPILKLYAVEVSRASAYVFCAHSCSRWKPIQVVPPGPEACSLRELGGMPLAPIDFAQRCSYQAPNNRLNRAVCVLHPNRVRSLHCMGTESAPATFTEMQR